MKRKEEFEKAGFKYVNHYSCLICDRDDVLRGFVNGAYWADKHPVNPWHSVSDGDLPRNNDDVLCQKDIELIIGYYSIVDNCFYGTNSDCRITDIKYWMEIPKLPTE